MSGVFWQFLTVSDQRIRSVQLIWLVRNESFLNAPVLLLYDVAYSLASLEVPSLAVFAEEIKLDVRKLKVQVSHVFPLTLSLLDFEQHELAKLTCFYSRLGLHMLNLEGVVGELLALVRQQ